MLPPNLPIPEVKKSEIAYRGYFDVHIDTLQLPHGAKRPYTVLHMGYHAVAVIAEVAEKKLVITQEYRYPVKQWLLSCPGGCIDPGESPQEAARRELLEETGYGDGELSILGTIFPFPAVANQQITFVYAKNVKYLQPPMLDEFELIHSQLKTPEELLHAISIGAPVDGVFCSGLFLWRNLT